MQISDHADLARQLLAGEITATPELIVSVLSAASEQYNEVDDSFLTDEAYDTLDRWLIAIDPENAFLKQVGSAVRGGKVRLPFAMGSLDQVFEGDTEKWVAENGWGDEDFVISDKEDGTSSLLVYGENKRFEIGYSRGDGMRGADITRHLNQLPIPKRSAQPLTVRAEVIMEDAVFEELRAAAAADGRRVYKNARNYVAGRMNASESPEEFYRNAHVIATSIVDPKMGKCEQFRQLEAMGFETPFHVKVKGRDLTDAFLVDLLAIRRSASATAIDGLVIDLDNAALRAELRRRSSSLNPMYSKKFKVGDVNNSALAKVVSVHWEASKTGYLKPRVEIEPVDLVGVTITFATGFNAKFIRDKGVGPGAVIEITRAGDVIPFIRRVEESVEAQLPQESEFGAMSWSENDVDLILDEPEQNDQVRLNILVDTFDSLEIAHLREGSLEKLFGAGFETASAIIKMSLEGLQAVIGASAGQKSYTGIHTRLQGVELGDLAGASQMLGRGIGKRKMRRLIAGLGGDDAFLALVADGLTAEKIVAVEGFETKTADTIIRNMPRLLAFLKEIDGLYTLGKPPEPTSDDLKGVAVCFTGVRDKDLEAAIVARGGTIASGVSAKTTHVVCKDPKSTSGKAVKARDLGIEPMDLEAARSRWL